MSNLFSNVEFEGFSALVYELDLTYNLLTIKNKRTRFAI